MGRSVMSTVEPIDLPAKPKRRWWKRIVISLVVAALVPFVVYRYNAWRLDRELAEVIAELDEKEPGWRLEDLERNRRQIPDAENGALVVTAAHGKIPKDWLNNPLWEELDKLPPAVRLWDEKRKE